MKNFSNFVSLLAIIISITSIGLRINSSNYCVKQTYTPSKTISMYTDNNENMYTEDQATIPYFPQNAIVETTEYPYEFKLIIKGVNPNKKYKIFTASYGSQVYTSGSTIQNQDQLEQMYVLDRAYIEPNIFLINYQVVDLDTNRVVLNGMAKYDYKGVD